MEHWLLKEAKKDPQNAPFAGQIEYACDLLGASVRAPAAENGHPWGAVPMLDLVLQMIKGQPYEAAFYSDALRLCCAKNNVTLLDLLLSRGALLSNYPGGGKAPKGSYLSNSAQERPSYDSRHLLVNQWTLSLADAAGYAAKDWLKEDAYRVPVSEKVEGSLVNVCLLNGSFDCLAYLWDKQKKLVSEEVRQLREYPVGSVFLEHYFSHLQEYFVAAQDMEKKLGIKFPQSAEKSQAFCFNAHLQTMTRGDRTKVFKKLMVRNKMGVLSEVMQGAMLLHPLLSLFREKEERVATEKLLWCEKIGLFENMGPLISQQVIKAALNYPSGVLKNAYLQCLAVHKVSTPFWVDGCIESIFRESMSVLDSDAKCVAFDAARAQWKPAEWGNFLEKEQSSKRGDNMRLEQIVNTFAWLDQSGQLAKWESVAGKKHTIKAQVLHQLVQPLLVSAKKLQLCEIEQWLLSEAFARHKLSGGLCEQFALDWQDLKKIQEALLEMLTHVGVAALVKPRFEETKSHYVTVSSALEHSIREVLGAPTSKEARVMRL